MNSGFLLSNIRIRTSSSLWHGSRQAGGSRSLNMLPVPQKPQFPSHSQQGASFNLGFSMNLSFALHTACFSVTRARCSYVLLLVCSLEIFKKIKMFLWRGCEEGIPGATSTKYQRPADSIGKAHQVPTKNLCLPRSRIHRRTAGVMQITFTIKASLVWGRSDAEPLPLPAGVTQQLTLSPADEFIHLH